MAQAMLGTMYEAGDGVPKDLFKARELYSLAAQSGNCLAMMRLGTMYSDGRFEAKDFVAAYMWSNLAVQYGCPVGADIRDEVAGKMTREDISEAQKRTREWKLTVNRRR